MELLSKLAKLLETNPLGLSPKKPMEYPNVRQIPYAYYTEEHGPVYAYDVDEKVNAALCVTWDDKRVTVAHDALLPFLPNVEGADVIELLDTDVSEMRSPHMDGPAIKWSQSRRSTIGEELFRMNIWTQGLYNQGEARL